MRLTLTTRDQTLLLRSVTLPQAIHQKIASAPATGHHLHLDLSDDEFLTLAQHLTLTLRTIKNAKTRRTFEQILDRLTEQNEAHQAVVSKPSSRAGFSHDNIHTIIDNLERDEPGWDNFSLDQMVEKFAGRMPFVDEARANQAIKIIVERHNQRARPGFHGLAPKQVSTLLNNDWSTDTPGLFLCKDNLTSKMVQDTIVIKRALTLLNALGEKGTPATKVSGNLNRKFIASLLDRFEIPAKDLADLRDFNKVINEDDVWPLHEMHLWLKLGKLVRLYRGRIVPIKRAHVLLADNNLPALYIALFGVVFLIFNLAYRDRFQPVENFQRTLAYSLHQIARLETGWHDIDVILGRLILPEVAEQMFHPHIPKLQHLLLRSRFLDPLSLFGLVELKFEQPNDGDRYAPKLIAIRRTKLFDAFIGIRWE